jgi:hypothetical protein
MPGGQSLFGSRLLEPPSPTTDAVPVVTGGNQQVGLEP